MGAKRGTAAIVGGALLAVFGTTAALVVGSDDTIMIGEQQAPREATGLAVATHPVITDFVNLDLLVRARAPGGVFVGAAHRVDSENLLADVRHYEISKMSMGSIDGRMSEGAHAGTAAVLRPAELTGWVDRTSTSSSQETELVVPLTTTPVDVLVVPSQPDSRVTIALGVHVQRLFVLQLGVAATGLALVLLGLALRWRHRRRRLTPSAASSATNATEAPDAADAATVPAPTLPSSPRTQRSRLPLPGLPRPAALGGLALALAFTGCSVPGPAPDRSHGDELTRPGMTLAEAGEVVDDPSDVYAPEFAAYPLWAVVRTDDPTRLQVRTRGAFAKPWRKIATVRVRTEMPAPVTHPITPSRATRARVDRASEAVARWWSTGSGTRVRINASTRRARAALLASGVAPNAIWAVGGTGKDQYVVEVSGGYLAVVRHTVMTPSPHRLTTVLYLRPGQRVRVLGSRLTPGS